jgi:hypothetical protein
MSRALTVSSTPEPKREIRRAARYTTAFDRRNHRAHPLRASAIWRTVTNLKIGAHKMRRCFVILGVLLPAVVVPPASAQAPHEGEARVGLAIQNDTRFARGIRLSPIGIVTGLSWLPRAAGHLAIVDQLSLFPTIRWDRVYQPIGGFDPDTAFDSGNLLAINTTVVRLATASVDARSAPAWFAEVGLAGSLATPRRGNRLAPVFGGGIRSYGTGKLGLETSVQCTAPDLGRTVCVLPVSMLFAVGR